MQAHFGGTDSGVRRRRRRVLTAPTNSELEDILMRADYKSLRRIMNDITDEQRRLLAKAAIASYRKAWSAMNQEWLRCALHAVLITATPEQVDKLSFSWIGSGDLDLELMAEHRPSTLQKWLEGHIAQHRIHLEVVAKLVERGLCVEPDTDEYVMHLMGSLRMRSFKEPVVLLLKRDKRFIDHYVWRLFEVEGNGENSLAANDKYSVPNATWQFALIQLSREGLLSRDRLLDASLDALDRGFLQFRSSWYSRFHEALEPTLAERNSRVSAYANLAASSIPTTVSFALNALGTIAKFGALPADLLITSLEPALSAKSKSSVLSVLSLIELAIKGDPDSTLPLCRLAARGFTHESPDVQTRIAKLINKHMSCDSVELRSELERYQEYLAPSVRKLLGRWLDSECVNGESIALAPVAFDATYQEGPCQNSNPLDTAGLVEPFQSVDALISGCSRSLEHPSDVIQIERAIDGIVRFCSGVPSDFAERSAPLRKRALFIKQSQSESITFLQRVFAGFVYCWLTDEMRLPYRTYYKIASQEFMHARLSALLERIIRRNSLPVLSAPTHERGWIEPAALVTRWQLFIEAKQDPDEYDQAIALLRMPLAQLERLLPDYVSLQGNFWDAVRFAKGHSDLQTDDGSRLWLAANSYRKPVKPAVLFNLGEGALYQQQSEFDFVRCIGMYFPAIRNQFVASGIRRVGTAIDYFTMTERCVRAYIEVMLDPAFNFDQSAYHLLAGSLIISDPACAGVASDILIQLIDSSRLSVEPLGREIGRFLYCGRSKTKRLVHAVSDVARISPRHLSAVRQLLERALQGGEVVPRDLSIVLELLNELLHSEGRKVEDPATKKHLLTLAVGGKTGKLIRELTR
jgi:hypothetical protein